MSDKWILSDNKEECPECQTAVEHYRNLLQNAVEQASDWAMFTQNIALDYHTDLGGEVPGIGGIIEVDREIRHEQV